MKNTDSLISIIMPAYNAEKYIRAAIISTIDQDYENWELLVVNDGSTDRTKEIIHSIIDSRIRYFEQENKGVSAARNLALKHIMGAYICFLDADDALTKQSLLLRHQIFAQDNSIEFVDGSVEVKNSELSKTLWVYKPDFKGNPLMELLKLNGKCFLGNTWMIRRVKDKIYWFREEISHGEELVFYLSIAGNGVYSYTERPILICRSNPDSAMTDLDGLANGYKKLVRFVRDNITTSKSAFLYLKFKIFLIMAKSYLKKGDLVKSFKTMEYLSL